MLLFAAQQRHRAIASRNDNSNIAAVSSTVDSRLVSTSIAYTLIRRLIC